MQTMLHDSPGTLSFLMPKTLAKLKQCHSQRRCQMQSGSCRLAAWRKALSTLVAGLSH